MNRQQAYLQQSGKAKPKVLIVDDSEMNRCILAEILGEEFEIEEAETGAAAMEKLRKGAESFALVLLDIVMPEMDGFEVLVMMNKYRWIEYLPVVMISGETADSYVQKAYELGATDYISRPFDRVVVKRRAVNTITLYDRQRRLAALAADQIYEREKTSNLMTNVLSHVVESRNGESGLHVLHVSVMAEILAKALVRKTDRYSLTQEDISVLSKSAPLHDIGKIAIPEEILNKPGKLTKEEYELIKTHCMEGANMLSDLPLYQDEKLVRVAYEVCRWHHERYDGKGYPDGLKGDEIPITAQIVSIADVYDALVSERVYKAAIPHEQAVQMIVGGECGCFNPILIECFLEVQDKIKKELKLNSIRDQKIRDVRNTVDRMLLHEELSGQENTLRMLEHERTKAQFYASTSNDIGFEQVMQPAMLILSERDAGKLQLGAVTMDPLRNERYLEILGKKNLDELVRRMLDSTSEDPVFQLECRMKIGVEERWYRIICRSMWEEGKRECVSVVGKVIDIQEEHNRLMDIKWIATRDPLTGLLRWSYARKKILDIIKRNPDENYIMAILDLDYFKSANDEYGHSFGNQVLRYVAQKLTQAIDQQDIVARIGGDEFLVFIRCKENISEILDYLSNALTGSYGEFPISVSVGVSIWKQGKTGSYDDMLRQAEQALYVGKRRGRGQYCIYSEEFSDLFSVISPIESGIDAQGNVIVEDE